MKEKDEKEIKQFSYERPVLVNLSTSDFALYQGVAAAQCTSGSSATNNCSTGFIAGTTCTGGASVV